MRLAGLRPEEPRPGRGGYMVEEDTYGDLPAFLTLMPPVGIIIGAVNEQPMLNSAVQT